MRRRSTGIARGLATAGATAALVVGLSGTAAAQAPVPSPLPETQAPETQAPETQTREVQAPEVLQRSLYKTLVFEGGTNLLDLALFASVLGGHLYAGPAFLAVNATAAAAIYYGHEVAWGYLGPAPDEYEVKDNILKGITFRLASSSRAFAVGYGFTGDPVAATGFTVASAVGETVMYVTSEYGWGLYDRLRVPYTPTLPAGASMQPASWTTGVEIR